MDKKEFSPIEIDAIGEISNICLGNSASTLNMLVREKIDITPPRVEIIEKSEYIKEVSSKRVFVKVNYVEGLRGCSILMLEEQDAKAIADLMMGASATSLSIMLERKTDISTPEAQFMDGGQYLGYAFPNDDKFIKVGFRMQIGETISSPIVQLYPYMLAKAISDLFLIKKAKEKAGQGE